MKAVLSPLVWPLLAQVGLTLVLFLFLAIRKGKVVREGVFNREDAKLDPNKWPDPVVQVNNNLGNQFQSPILFYVLGLLFILANQVSTVTLVTAWTFVAARYAHCFVHTTSNNMKARTITFILGMLALLVLFGNLVFALLTAAPAS